MAFEATKANGESPTSTESVFMRAAFAVSICVDIVFALPKFPLALSFQNLIEFNGSYLSRMAVAAQ